MESHSKMVYEAFADVLCKIVSKPAVERCKGPAFEAKLRSKMAGFGTICRLKSAGFMDFGVNSSDSYEIFLRNFGSGVESEEFQSVD